MADDLRLAQGGDTAAFERLVRPCEERVWRLCWQMMGQTQDAEDALQETMLKAWRALGSCRGDAPFAAWLYGIALNTCRDLLRRRKARPGESLDRLAESGFDPPGNEPLPEEALARKEYRQEVRRAVDSLPEEMREPLLLCCAEDMPYAEAAALLGIAEGTLKSRISRGREKIKKFLQETGNKTGAAASDRVKGGRGHDRQ